MLKLDKRYIPKDRMSNIEVHITHACNLACESCSHYSNHGHSGNLTVDGFVEQVGPWSHKIKPKWLSLMGGEPTLNSKLEKIVEIAAIMWPDSKVRLITNGFFLHRFPDLPHIMKNYNCQLRISVHHGSLAYQEKVDSIRNLIANWERASGLEVEWQQDYKKWVRVYRGYGDSMLPYEDGKPRKSWERCGVKHCKQIFLGKLWKCPNLAYLQMQDKKFKLSEKWTPYLTYRTGDLEGQAIDPIATHSEIKAFYETENIFHCGMCPAYRTKFDLPSPLRGEK